MFRLLKKLLCNLGYHSLTQPKVFAKKIYFDDTGQLHEIPMSAVQFCNRQDCDHVQRLTIK